MKRRTELFLIILATLTGFTSCVKEISPIVIQKLHVSDSLDLIFGSRPDYLSVYTTYFTIISGNEAVAGYRIHHDLITDRKITSKGVCWSTSRNPTINDSKVEDGSLLYISHCHITGLELNTAYYFRPFAIYDDGRIEYGYVGSFITPATVYPGFFNPDLTYGSVTDIDDNLYKTIQIGTQTWMAENLKSTRYNDGSEIPNIIDNSQWISLKTGAYRWYENDEAVFKNLYGALYNWYTVNTGKLCPTGWHVPGDDEWKQLEMELGMEKEIADSWGDINFPDYRGTDQGIQMKATSGWYNWWIDSGINGNGTNTSGFSAIPGGDTGGDGGYCKGAGYYAAWWAADKAIAREVYIDNGMVARSNYNPCVGISVRCLEDK
jgi:uncharacterized protein (TIGR02145 family)